MTFADVVKKAESNNNLDKIQVIKEKHMKKTRFEVRKKKKQMVLNENIIEISDDDLNPVEED